MENIVFNRCIIGNDHIVIYKSSKKVSYSPAFEILIENGTATINGNSITITGNKVIHHIHFHKEYVKDLDYVPDKKDIKYTYFLKKPYVYGWVHDSKTEKLEKTFINYKIEIDQ
jgi:hypothetical protein